jgi:hypothetical protein
LSSLPPRKPPGPFSPSSDGDGVGVRARAGAERVLARQFSRRYVGVEDLDDWEAEGWERTGAVREGPFGSQLYEIAVKDTDNER